MKNSILIFTLTLCLNHLSGQNNLNLFDKARLLTKNDTIECYVNIQGTYNINIAYRLQPDSKILSASVDTVNFIITDYNCYGKIKVKNESIIPRILCWGKINYYEQIEFGPEVIKKGGSLIEDYTTYYIEKGDTIIKIPKRNIGERIAFLFNENNTICKEITKINRLDNDKLIKFIEEYNNYAP